MRKRTKYILTTIGVIVIVTTLTSVFCLAVLYSFLYCFEYWLWGLGIALMGGLFVKVWKETYDGVTEYFEGKK